MKHYDFIDHQDRDWLRPPSPDPIFEIVFSDPLLVTYSRTGDGIFLRTRQRRSVQMRLVSQATRIEYNPDFAHTRSTSDGSLPLHRVVGRPRRPLLEDDDEGFQLILDAFPGATQERNSQGRLPLHIACLAGRLWEAELRMLIASYPESLGEKDPISGLYPLQCLVLGYSMRSRDAEVAADRVDEDTSESTTVTVHEQGGVTKDAESVAAYEHGDIVSYRQRQTVIWMKLIDEYRAKLRRRRRQEHFEKNRRLLDYYPPKERASRELDGIYELLRRDPTVVSKF